MTNLGSTAQPGPSTQMYGLNVTNQFCSALTLPAGGPWKVTSIGCWLAGYGASSLYALCLWDNSMNLDREGPHVSIGSQPMGSYGATSATANISDIEYPGGTTVWVGFWRHSDDPTWFPHSGSGTRRQRTVGDDPTSMSGYSSATGNLGVWLVYEPANQPPNAPTLRKPAHQAVLTDMTPVLEFDHTDPDGDDIGIYDLQVDNSSSFGSRVWEVDHSSTSIDGNHVARQLGAAQWTGGHPIRGTTYYWRARTSDDFGSGYGEWSSGTRTFKINSLPSAAKVTPLAGVAANLWNLDEAAVWTDGGAHGKPRFDWNFSDPDGHSQSAFRVRIYSAASGGTLLHDSGEVPSSTSLYDAPWAGVRNTTYWWTIDVKDSLGEWQGESSRTSFLIKWAQAIYQHNTGLGSASWGFTSGAVSNGAAAFLFATATGVNGAGRSAWKSSVGALAIGATVAYVNVLVRLRPISTAVAAVSPTLPSMTFTFLATGVNPDRWVLA